ncbi:aldehyde dehydrogenase, dimeric NADP-preferring-like [Onthophagus taurus]|uniref:aldehyde dehydrogenase, dimeric NADP-preferring-like n=1 Tax=Onthophagus taurus TaxID=166361 RepID=UPI0039BE3754
MEQHLLVETLRKSFNSGKTRNLTFRKTQLKNLLKMYEETVEEMSEALWKDLKKSKRDTYMTEIIHLKIDVENILSNFDSYTKIERPAKTALVNIFDRVEIHNDPYGVVLIMGAWNFPLQLNLLPTHGAIASGNCVIIKPSELAPAISEYLAKTIPKYLDKDCYQVFQGGIEETQKLLKEKFDYIFLTGSPKVGKIVHQAAALSLTPTTLELGGKTPVYIDESCFNASMEIVTKRILWGKCINAGQMCVSPDYILCTKDVQKKFLEYAPKIIKEFFGENPKKSQDYCRIINSNHFERLQKLIDPAKIAFGGDLDPQDLYISPTILSDVHPNDLIMQEEIFGPILPILNVKDVQEAIDLINSKEKALAMYIFSNDAVVTNKILNSTSCGGVTVNGTIFHKLCPLLSHGGVGNSGMGSYHGKKSFDTFTHKKGVLKKKLSKIGELTHRLTYPPYSNLKINVVSKIRHISAEISFNILNFILTFLFGMIFASLINI